jgi:hypothetical protein
MVVGNTPDGTRGVGTFGSGLTNPLNSKERCQIQGQRLEALESCHEASPKFS